MATHFLTNESGKIKLYRLPRIDTFIVSVDNNTNIVVLSEYEGNDCSFHKIQINNNIYYVNVDDVKRLASTAVSAPYVCFQQFSSNFIEPDWIELEVDIPFYNPSEKTYNIPVLTNYINILNKEEFITYSIRLGTTKLLSYYYKDTSDEAVNKLLSYYKFAELKDYYVRPIKKARIKSLISIPKKYFDAVPSFTNVVGLQQDMQVFNLSTKNLTSKFLYLKNIMSFYDKILNSSNVQIDNFSFSKEFKKLLTFYEKLTNLFSINEILLKNDVDETIEIVLDNCGRFFSASLQVNGVCKYPLISLNNLVNNDYAKNSRTLNLLKNLDSLYNVDPCRTNVVDFIERYILYPPIVQKNGNSAPGLADVDFEKMIAFVNSTSQKLNSYSLNDELAAQAQNDYEPQLKKAIYDLKEFYNWESFYDKDKDIFKNINFSEDLTKLSNKKTTGTEYDKFEASLIPKQIENESKIRRSTIMFVYNILTINQVLCKLAPKAITCLLSLLATTVGENNGANLNLSLVATTTYNIEEIKTKIFPYLNKEEKQIILSELMEQFCLTNSDLISVLKESKNISKTDAQLYNTYSFDMLKQLILNEIVI